jgi:large subunit ribosomal protein L19
MNIIEKLNAAHLRKDIPHFKIGDVVKVHVKIIEGEKERSQVFSGTVIARTGSGINAAFTVRRISFGEGVERVFQVHSPRIEKIEISRAGDVRRAKLYYIREKIGKSSRIKEKKKVVIEGEETVRAAAAEQPVAPAAPVEQPKAEAKQEISKK